MDNRTEYGVMDNRTEYDNNGTIFLRKNDKRSDRDPDFWAYMTLDGREYRVAGWWSNNKNPPNPGEKPKPVMKLQLTPKTDARRQAQSQDQRPYQYQGQQRQQQHQYNPPQRAQGGAQGNFQRPLTQNQVNQQSAYDMQYDDNRRPPF